MKYKTMTAKEIQELPIGVFVIMCVMCALIMFGFSCCCQYCKDHHEEWEKERHEKYMEGYRARMAGCTGINWNGKD